MCLLSTLKRAMNGTGNVFDVAFGEVLGEILGKIVGMVIGVVISLVLQVEVFNSV